MGSKTMTISISGFVLCIPVDVGVRGGGGLFDSLTFFLSKYNSIHNKSQLFSMCLISCEKTTSFNKNNTKDIFMM